MDRRNLPVDEKRGQENLEEAPKAGTPWGFFLVLAAIVVVAIVYSVSIIALALKGNLTAETVFGAMAACFTVIGTLVGTYFGIKAGLDGQDKVKDTVRRVIGESDNLLRIHTEMNGDQKREGRPAEEPQRGARERRERSQGEPEERRGWEGVGV
jgi:hypothetical protein